jgi:CcmD family protein
MSAAVLGELPALPLHEAGKYVAGAYVVVFTLVLLYVAIMAVRLGRIERQLGELLEQDPARTPEEIDVPHPESTLL